MDLATDAPGRKIQHLPCRIHHDGPALVDAYMIVDETPSGLETAFRGRKLLGKSIAIATNLVEKTSDGYKRVGRSDSVLVWAHGHLPDETHPIQHAVDWIKYNQVLHG
ncbi:hypothetical protein EDD86DRAFT_203422 [Gorgonomyces haynaldii]|nr:hypothetical protein EDD86DRAFT_203422 [Gorgonomyces haynaldii]